MKKLDIPYFKQIDVDHCGPCALSMILKNFGSSLTQEQITSSILKQQNGSTKKNTYMHDMVCYIADNGFGSLYIANLDDDKAWKVIKTYVRKGYPLLALTQYNKIAVRSHFRVIVRHEFIEKKNEHWIYFHDPTDGLNQRLSKKEFFELWKAKKSTDQINENVFLILKEKPFNIPDDKCNFCNSDKLNKAIWPENIPRDFSFINTNTNLKIQCEKLLCTNCNVSVNRPLFD